MEQIATSTPQSAPPKRHHLADYKGHWWKPGQSGNPSGRPRAAVVTDALRGYYQANPREIARLILVAHRWALKGNVKFWEMIVDRLEGKVPQAISVSGSIHHSIGDDERMAIDQMSSIMNVIDIETTDIKPK